MELHPDLTEYGYEVMSVLGHNYGANRSTYLAHNLIYQELVVIKLFRFPKSVDRFAAYEKAIAREAEILQQVQHPQIPRYLSSFDTIDGYCIVQQYVKAQSLANPRRFSLEQIQQLAIAALEILVYLQNQTPPIIHRDIKPENLLVSDDLKLYLVDFGFARIGVADNAMSSVAAGTFGFMAPEQLRNGILSAATDNYGLGMTLICLLTGIRSTQVDRLINEDNQIQFQHLLTNVNPRFAQWLKKMTAPKLKDRYRDAATALEHLLQIGEIGLAKSRNSGWRRVPIYLLPVAIASLLTFSPTPAPEKVSTSISPAPLPTTPLKITTPPSPCIDNRNVKLTQIEEQDGKDSLVKLQINRECRGCDFRGARNITLKDLKSVDLQNADLRGVSIVQSDLSDANFKGANLEGANFTQSVLKNADFSESRAKCTNFIQSVLPNSMFTRADLTSARLIQAKMAGSDLSYANLNSADLSQADLIDANLDNANLANTDMTQTTLKNATMDGVIIKNTKINPSKLPNNR